jgi:hypothetical protein
MRRKEFQTAFSARIDAARIGFAANIGAAARRGARDLAVRADLAWRAEAAIVRAKLDDGRDEPMWRDQIDAFWDGGRLLALGFFEGAERASAFAARPDILVTAAKDPAFSGRAAFVDAIDSLRWRSGFCTLTLPADHPYLLLRAPDGTELRLALTGEKTGAAGGEQRLLMALAPEASGGDGAAFRVAAFSMRGDFERLAREQIALAGPRLVWALGQRRLVERRDGPARQTHLWPARRVFPAFQSRLSLEPVDVANEANGLAQQAPFAIMDHWLRENGAPRIVLRLRVPDSLDESARLLNRASAVLVMRQRQRLRDWTREQREAGEPIVEPLAFDDIRQAAGDPTEHPDAVEGPDSVVVANLLRLASEPDSAFDGFAARRQAEPSAPGLGATLDIEFYAAALGDEIGVVSVGAEAGDLGAAPLDPGGAAFARLFRVEADGVKPRRIGEDDPLLDELLRRAADEERAPTGAMARSAADRAASIHGRREKFVAALNVAFSRIGFPGRLDASALWDQLEPLLLASYAAQIVDATEPGRTLLQKLGGYGAFRADPSLLATLARRAELAGDDAPLALAHAREAGAASLLARFLSACGADGLARSNVGAEADAAMLRLLLTAPGVERAKAARLELSGDADIDREAPRAAEALSDAEALERAAERFLSAGLEKDAAALRLYLSDRRDGHWTRLTDATRLTALLARAEAERRQAESDAATKAAQDAARAPEPAQRPRGLFGAVRGLFGRGGEG